MTAALEPVAGGDGIPPEPAWASVFNDELDQALATEVWGRTIREMRERETLAPVNGLAIKRYVMACVLHDQAARMVNEQGAVVKAKRTSAPSYNPWWAVMKDADARCAAHEASLGLAPRDRQRVGKVNRAKKATIGGGFLKSVPK